MATVVRVEDISAGATSRAPATAASRRPMPSWPSRMMFSWTMMDASIDSPTAKASPASEMTFRLWPVTCSARNAPISDSGMLSAITSVARMIRRK